MHPSPSPSQKSDARARWSLPPGSFLGTFLGLLAGSLVFSFSSTDVSSLRDRPIGDAILQGVDASRRVSIYLSMVAAVLGSWLACHYAAQALRRRAPSWFLGARSRLENDVCATFCAVGSVALVARATIGRLDGLAAVNVCLIGVVAVVVLALARRLSRRQSLLRRALSSLPTLAPLLALPWPFTYIVGLFGAERRALLGALLVTTVYAVGFVWTLRRRGRQNGTRVRQAFALSALPFFAFPGSCPVANEIAYTLAHQHPVAPQTVALVFLGLLTLAAALLFWAALGGRLRLSPGRLLSRFMLPAIVFGTGLMAVYQHQLTESHVDPLEDGEQITSIYQLLRWGKWPFIDTWPGHGLYDYVGALYAKVNGFHPFELTAWNGILAALSATAAYAILARVSTPLFAVCVATLLPIEALFPVPQYSFFCAEPGLLLVGLLVYRVLARPSLRGYALLSASTFLCFFWTPTSGVACIASVFALLSLSFITARDRRVARRGLEVFAATGALVLVLYAVTLLGRGQPLFETLRLVKTFIQADPMIGGRVSVIERFDSLAFFQYLILPAVGLLYLGRLARHALERRPLDRVEQLLGFLALASLVLFARTLTRHGLIERYQPFYFPFLALALLMPGADKALARAWFCAGLCLYLVVFPVWAPRQLSLEPFAFHAWQRDEPRYAGATPQYPALHAFLDGTLQPKQTFLELLNMSLLYTVLEREVPGQFFLPSMFYATDSVQDSYLARLQAFGGSERVPVVLLPVSNAKNWNSYIDGIPNTLRSYRIAEHVYRQYVPFGVMDGAAVWVSRARFDEAGEKVPSLALSWREPDSYRTESLEASRLEGDVLRLVAKGRAPQISRVVALGGVQLGGLESAHAVRFLYRTSVPGTLQIFFRYADHAADSSQVALVAGSEWQAAQLWIPPRPESGIALKDLRFHPPVGSVLEIRALELAYGGPSPQLPQSYSAGMLPFLWGNLDARLSSTPGKLEQSLAVPEGNPRLTAFDLTLNVAADKSKGNYLQLCLRLPDLNLQGAGGLRRWKTIQHAGGWQSAGAATLSYGEPPSTFDFTLVSPDPNAPGLPGALVRSFEHECKRYLVRLSAQYAWNSQPVAHIQMASSVPLILESAALFSGD